MRRHQAKSESDSLTVNCERYNLVLYNDDVNTFEHVIKCLVEICGHTPEQAEQCALIVHHKGRYEIKSGSYPEMSPLKERLNANALTANIE